MRTRWMMLVAATTLALSGALAGMAPAASANDGHNGRHDRHRDQSVVWPGQSIQAAIDAAQPGDTIIVRPGVYHGSLEIATNGIHLIGFHAVIVPAATPGGSLCNQGNDPPTETGICVHGQVDDATGDVIQTVDNVVVAGFRVNGFSGDGTFVYGGHNFTAFNDEFSHNGGYGIFSLHSENVSYIGNLSHDNGEAGLYVGESPKANVDVEHNVSWRNLGEGLLFRDSLGGHVSGNSFTGNCIGVLALNDGSAGPGPFGNVRITDNWIVANNKACPAGEGPPTSGLGVGIAGNSNVVVRHNVINKNVPGGPTGVPSGGIALIAFDPSSPPNNNTIVGNYLHGNVDNDIFSDGSGTGNVFKFNRCNTSDPAGLCA